jgi:nitroreductase/Pyruvate/2-oxoacid:ferredoxin oxidoreductase delta subunit
MLNKENPVEVIVDKQKCTKCGICMGYCHSYLEKDEEGFPRSMKLEESYYGCIQCGHCMMACPSNAIEIKGEDIDKSHLRELNTNLPDFNALNALFLKRRSIRKFKDQEVPKEALDKIVQAAATAPLGLPPSELKVLIINGKEKVEELLNDMVKEMESAKKMVNPLTLSLLKLFSSNVEYKKLKDFILPLCDLTIKERKAGIDHLLYNAPAVMLIYSTELGMVQNSVIATTYATLAAETLGLGTCWIETFGALFKNNKNLREKYGILKGEKFIEGMILGYPDTHFNKAFQRNFKEVKYIN